MNYDGEHREAQSGHRRKRPRDKRIDEAKAVLRGALFTIDPRAVYYQRQVETLYERQFFHWITAKALNELADKRVIATDIKRLRGNTPIRFYRSPQNRYWVRQANAIRELVLAFPEPCMARAIGQQRETMFDAALPRVGLMPAALFKNVTSFGGPIFGRSGAPMRSSTSSTTTTISPMTPPRSCRACARTSANTSPPRD